MGRSVLTGACLCLLFFATMKTAAAQGVWLRGDLHAHSSYSDGDSPVGAVVEAAESLGLDFFVLTDHDVSMGGEPVHWDDPDYRSESTVLLYGIEWTTLRGHANLWAAAPFPYDGMLDAKAQRDPGLAVAEAHEQGALFSINHPAAFFCCPWIYDVPEGLDAVEVWNSMYRVPNFNRWAGHLFWDGLLRQGRRVTGVGGSDTHHLQGWISRLFGYGNPTTWVYAAEKSAEAVLAAIRSGRVAVSRAPDAPRLEFAADGDGDGTFETMMGDAAAGGDITLRVFLAAPSGVSQQEAAAASELPEPAVAMLRAGRPIPVPYAVRAADRPYIAGVFKNGILLRAALVAEGGEFVFTDSASPGDYYRAEAALTGPVRLSALFLYGRLAALSNPLYIAGY